MYVCVCVQEDYLFGGLTIRESLIYSALLKLPDDMQLADKLLRVEVSLPHTA